MTTVKRARGMSHRMSQIDAFQLGIVQTFYKVTFEKYSFVEIN